MLETKPNRDFYAAAREPKAIWEVPDGRHIAGITTEPAEYERRVIGFFDKYSAGEVVTQAERIYAAPAWRPFRQLEGRS